MENPKEPRRKQVSFLCCSGDGSHVVGGWLGRGACCAQGDRRQVSGRGSHRWYLAAVCCPLSADYL